MINRRKLREVAEKTRAGETVGMTVRQLLALFGTKRRGYRVEWFIEKETPGVGFGHRAKLQDAEGVRHDGVVCGATDERADQSRPRRVVMGGTGEGLESAQLPVPPVVSACQKTASLALIALATTSCDPVAGPEATAIHVTPFVSSEVPLSVNGYVALATEATACVLNDYETQLHCIYRDGGQADVFGRRGGGPGEFRSPPRRVTRGPDGTVAVIGYHWVALFEPAGRFVAEVRVPRATRLSASADSVLMGTQLEIDRPSRAVDIRHLEIDVGTGEILWEGYFPTSIAAQADCPPRVFSSGRTRRSLGNARRFPSGGIVFFALCRGQMLFLSHPDDESGILVQPPLYTLEYPTRRDVERYLEACELPSSRVLGLPCEVERFRRTPKHYGIYYWVDDRDRLWVLTDRDREEYSYLDVYTGPEFSGSVRVRHRGVGFDVLGSTLAVLVDRPVGPEDPDGIPDRGIDWYDIEGLEFGRLPSSRFSRIAKISRRIAYHLRTMADDTSALPTSAPARSANDP